MITDTLRMKRIAEIDSPVCRDVLARRKRPGHVEQPGVQAASLTRSARSSSVSAQKPALGSSPVPGSFRRCHKANSRRADKADQRCGNNRHQNDAHSLTPKSDGSVVPHGSCVGSLARNWHEQAAQFAPRHRTSRTPSLPNNAKGHGNASECREFRGRFCRSSGGLLETHSRLACDRS